MRGSAWVADSADREHIAPANMLTNIQALRFYAAFVVVLYHSRKLFTELGCQGDWFLNWARYGNTGVDVFFVISGYVMWHTTRNSPRTITASAEFIRRRLFRIYLGYWPFYFLAAAVILLLSDRDLANIRWLEDFFLLNNTIRHQVLGVAWTLSYELYFYAVFAPMILLAAAQMRYLLLALFLGVIAINMAVPVHNYEYGFFLTSFLIEFFAGCLLAAYLGNNRSRLVLLFCLAVIVVMINYAVTLPRFHMNRIQGFGVASMFIVLAAVLLENTRLYVASRLWVFLGNCSYSIYLVHLIVFWIYRHLLEQMNPQIGPVEGFVIYLSSLAVILALSILNYYYVEAPLYKYALNNWFTSLRGARATA